LKKLAFLGGAAGLGILALLYSPLTQAADHLDSPSVSAPTSAMADITDVFAWMTTDGTQVNLALDVSPADPGTRSFGPDVLYAMHITSRPGFGMTGTESKIICKFADNTHGECWVTDPAGKTIDYVNGDLSGPVGRVSRSGKFRVFAGQRSDPFFFNFAGFKKAVATAEGACGAGMECPGAIPTDAAKCPLIDKATAGALVGLIGAESTTAVGPCPANQIDCFENFNVMAIVVQIDKTELLNGTDKLVSVWASTHAAQ